VTFDPTNSIFEFSGDIGSETAAAVKVEFEFIDELDGADVWALNLLAAGSSHAARNNDNNRTTKRILLISTPQF
jgi:hypothetical protein